MTSHLSASELFDAPVVLTKNLIFSCPFFTFVKKMKKYLFPLVILLLLASCRKHGDIHLNDYGFFVNNCQPPFEVQFYIDVDYAGRKIEYHWDFGDGTQSDEQNPVHTYGSTGKYTATVTVTNYDQTKLYRLLVDVSKNPMNPKADFTFDFPDSNNYAPARVQFYNRSQYASNFFWNFGDGYGSSLTDPLHTYEKEGNYQVVLKAICPHDTSIYSAFVKIAPPPGKIIVKQVDVWLPQPDYVGEYFNLHIYFNDTELTYFYLDEVFADQFPITWEPDQTIEEFDGEYDNSTLYFEITDQYDEYVIYTFDITLHELQSQHYPTEINFDDGDFGATLYLDYEP